MLLPKHNKCFGRNAANMTAYPNVRFWGQSGHRLVHCTCPLMTQSGHWAQFLLPVRAILLGFETHRRPKPRGAWSRAPTRFHKSCFRLSSDVATSRMGPATKEASDRASRQYLCRCVRLSHCLHSPRAERNRLCGGQECNDRISLGDRPKRK